MTKRNNPTGPFNGTVRMSTEARVELLAAGQPEKMKRDHKRALDQRFKNDKF